MGDALFEAGRILLPEQVMQEDPHGIHSYRFGPAELFVDLERVERRLLPHFELVDRRLGYVVAPDQPGLARVPGICLLLRPARAVCAGATPAPPTVSTTARRKETSDTVDV